MLAPIAEAVAGGQGEPLALYAKLRVHYVREDEIVRYDPLLLSFRHVSTPEQYRVALAELESVGREAP
ncbi:hypothetical protein D3C78_1768050 [compost metagenome]